MNTGYVLWFAALVAVAGAVLIWLAVGDVPEVSPDADDASEPRAATEPGAVASEPLAASEPPAPAPEPLAASEPPAPASEPIGVASEHPGEDGVARPG